MYYPKSQVKTNLYTNGGDFTTRNPITPYKGYYYETANGKYFSGKTPNESPTFELVKINPNESPTNLPASLQVENQNLKVVVKGVDPTDWVYINMVDEEDVNVENVYDEEIGYRRRLVIDGGMF